MASSSGGGIPSSGSVSNPPTDPTAQLSKVEDLFKLLETGKADVVSELKQSIKEQFQQVREPWLVQGLYDYFLRSNSPRGLEILITVDDPHDKFLCDKITESLKSSSKQTKLSGLTFMGYLIRKQTSWLYKVTQHVLMKELLKILRTEEDDLVVLMSALLDLLAMMPLLPSYMNPFLNELFDIFSRLASWRYQHIKGLPEIQQVHIQVGLFALFHRLYGMFPCNFLSYLRSQYSETNKENHLVFMHTIRPMLHTVRMHPLLVTHSREQEKNVSRWKRMEVHDILVEACRYSLAPQESTKEDNIEPVESDPNSIFRDMNTPGRPDIYELCTAIASHDPLWTPSRKIDQLTPGIHAPPSSSSLLTPINPASSLAATVVGSKTTEESPPEAAVEATPETTPWPTPVKDEKGFQLPNRPIPSKVVSRQLDLGEGAGMSPSLSHSLARGDTRSPKLMPSQQQPLSPLKETPFRFERRDSLFVDQLHVENKLSRIGNERSSLTVAVKSQMARMTPVEPIPESRSADDEENRSSPVKFTSQRPQQFPLKPEPERPLPAGGANKLKDTLPQEFLAKPEEEELNDDEVSKITCGSDNAKVPGESSGNNFSTRHITPQICSVESSEPSRNVSRASQSESRPSRSRLSSAMAGAVSNTTGGPVTNTAATATTSSECKSGGIHPPSVSSVHDFVRQVRGRIRYFSVCAANSGDIAEEVRAAMAASDEAADGGEDETPERMKRSLSCPNASELLDKASKSDSQKKVTRLVSPTSSATNAESIPGPKTGTSTSEVQTDEFIVFPYEHLFPSVLPQWFTDVSKQTGEVAPGAEKIQESDNPYHELDRYVQAAIEGFEGRIVNDDKKDLRSQITLLYNLMLYERHRREILGARNRRLLGKTKSSRILEELNNALKTQLQIVEAEAHSLLDELESVRKQKHEVEEARSKAAKQRDQQIEDLVSQNRTLKEKLHEQADLIGKQEDELKNVRMEKAKVEAGLFRAKSEVSRLESKEDDRKRAENELVHLRKEILLLGELQLKYKEKLRQPWTLVEKQEELYMEAYQSELTSMKMALTERTAEVEAYKAKMQEMEQTLTRKEVNISEQKRMIKRIKEENQENLKSVETANDVLLESQAHLEAQIMQLQANLAHSKNEPFRHPRRPPLNAAEAPAVTASQQPVRKSNLTESLAVAQPSHFVQSANVDIRRGDRAILKEEKSPGEDKSFIVGSPPSSNDGRGVGIAGELVESYGGISSEGSSDFNYMRRMRRREPTTSSGLSSGGGVGAVAGSGAAGGQRRVDASFSELEIGSATSAKETFGTSGSSHNSMNGTHQ